MPYIASLSDNPAGFRTDLAKELPQLGTNIRQLETQIIYVVGRFLPLQPSNHAAALVVNQAANDFIDLCFEIEHLRGRAALRAARSMFEHAVNLMDVTSNRTAQNRYEAHASVAAQVEAEAAIGLNLLKGNELRSYGHALKKLRNSSATTYERAVETYGSGFRSRWASSDLYHRVQALGLSAEYPFYRLSSMILHGTAGGARGTLLTTLEASVHRTGPALALCPPAFLQGVRYFRLVVETMQDTAGDQLDAALLIELTDSMLDLWPAYRRIVLRMDRAFWPKQSPPGAVGVLGISRSGRRQWFLHVPEIHVICRASAPRESELPANLDRIVERCLEEELPPEEWDGNWLTIGIVGVHPVPMRNARWMPEWAILPQGEPNAVPRKIKI
jgi:hypothetical protein